MTKVTLKQAFEETNSLSVDSGFLAGGIKKATELTDRLAPSYIRAEALVNLKRIMSLFGSMIARTVV